LEGTTTTTEYSARRRREARQLVLPLHVAPIPAERRGRLRLREQFDGPTFLTMAAKWCAASRAAQGLPPYIADPSAVRRLVVLMGWDRTPPKGARS
jgi:hypothetical protein